MRSRAIAIGAAIVVVAGLVAAGLLVWPGLSGDDPFRSFRPDLQHPSEVAAQLGDPDQDRTELPVVLRPRNVRRAEHKVAVRWYGDGVSGRLYRHV